MKCNADVMFVYLAVIYNSQTKLAQFTSQKKKVWKVAHS